MNVSQPSSGNADDNSEHITSFCTTVLVGLSDWSTLKITSCKRRFMNDPRNDPCKKWGYYGMTKPILEWHLHAFTYCFLSTSWTYSIFFAFCANQMATEQLFWCEQLNSCQGGNMGWWIRESLPVCNFGQWNLETILVSLSESPSIHANDWLVTNALLLF